MLWEPEAHEPLVEEPGTRSGRGPRSARSPPTPRRRSTTAGRPSTRRRARRRRSGGRARTSAAQASSTRCAGSRRGLVELAPRLRCRTSSALDARHAAGPSLMVGETGILLVRQRLSPSAAAVERLRELDRRERRRRAARAALGQPGDDARRARARLRRPLAARRQSGLLADPRPRDGPLGAAPLRQARHDTWAPAHGFAGCVLALGDVDGAAETARRYAVVEDGLANWPPLADGVLVAQRHDPPAVVPRRTRA